MYIKNGLRRKSFCILLLISISMILNSCMKANTIHGITRASQVTSNYEVFSGEEIELSGQVNSLTGAFGNLQLESYILQPSIEFLKNQIDNIDLYALYESSSQWTFNDLSFREIQSIFLNAGLSNKTCNQLLSATKAAPNGNGFITTPPESVLWSFTPEVRAKLYAEIGKHQGNNLYTFPLFYNSENTSEWLYESNIKDKKLIENIQSLIYLKDGVSYISDLHLILPLITSDEEWFAFLQTIYRTKSLEVYLQIDENENLDKLADYWGSLDRGTTIKSILEQSAKNSNKKINITELFPEIPQLRYNTFSGLKEFQDNSKDCHWTTINFTNIEPDERYYNLKDFFTFMDKLSIPNENSQPKFGDIVYIYNKDNEITHSCVYIADNLVFTKNGIGNLNPFTITYLDKIVSFYGGRVVYNSRIVLDTHSIRIK